MICILTLKHGLHEGDTNRYKRIDAREEKGKEGVEKRMGMGGERHVL